MKERNKRQTNKHEKKKTNKLQKTDRKTDQK